MQLSRVLWLAQIASSWGRLAGVDERNAREGEARDLRKDPFHTRIIGGEDSDYEHGKSREGEARDPRKDSFNTRIIGGEYSDFGEYPYAVSLKRGNGHFCGGSLIARDVVLSAAHCGGGRYTVVVGRHKQSSYSRGDTFSVREEVLHPRYRSSGTDNDFGLIFLRGSASADAELVRLNERSAVPATGESVTVMGWGDTLASESASRPSNTLKEAELQVVSNRRCAQASGWVGFSYSSYRGAITDNMLCAQDRGEDSCQGDSGGPLVVKGRGRDPDVQVGVVSWGVGCADENFPGVYARVSSAYKWIRDEVCEKSASPPPSFRCSPPDAADAIGQSNDIGFDDEDYNYYSGVSGDASGGEVDDSGGGGWSFASWTCSVFGVWC